MKPRAQPGRLSLAKDGALLLAAAAMLVAPALLAGHVGVMGDTGQYYAAGEYLAQALHLVGRSTLPPGDPNALPVMPGAPNIAATVIAARSPIYGALLYPLARFGQGLWAVAAIQALIAAWTVLTLIRVAAPGARPMARLGAFALLATTTSLPFFAGFAMPDLFTGLLGADAILIFVYWDRLSHPQRAGVFLATVFALASHRSNLVDGAALLVCGGGALIALRASRRRIAVPVGVLAASLLTAWLAGTAAKSIMETRAGEAISNPPFLTARLLADGPGRRYLRHACVTGEAFVLCRYRDRPLDNSDEVLWTEKPGRWVFSLSDYPTRRRLEAEQGRFVADVLRYDPLGVLAASARNVGQLFMNIYVDDPIANPTLYYKVPYWRRTILPRLIPRSSVCMARGHYHDCDFPISPMLILMVQLPVLMLSGLALGWRLLRPQVWVQIRYGPPVHDTPLGRALTTTSLCLTLVLVNAVVCAALSGVFSRYETRLIWLVPLDLLIVLAEIGLPVMRRRPGTVALPSFPAST